MGKSLISELRAKRAERSQVPILQNKGGVFSGMVANVLGDKKRGNPEFLGREELARAGNPYFLLEEDLRAAADKIYQDGHLARDARSEHLRRLLYGNDAETQAAINAGQTEAKLARTREPGTGNNELRPEDELAGGMNRVKALSRIAMATSDAGKMGLLQQRMQAAQAGRGTQATGLRAIAKFNEQLSGYQGGMDAVNQFRDANKANFIGGLAGVAAGVGANLWANRAKPVNVPATFNNGAAIASSVGPTAGSIVSNFRLPSGGP